MQDLLHPYPGRNAVQPDKCTMRQIVASVTCAIKDWIDDFYPCYIWKDAPVSMGAGAPEHDDDQYTEAAEEKTEEEK